MIAAYAYYREAANNFRLASIGLISFAAVAQFAPSFVGGLIWRGANARGAKLGMAAGMLGLVRSHCFSRLLSVLNNSIVQNGLFGLAALSRNRFWDLAAIRSLTV